MRPVEFYRSSGTRTALMFLGIVSVAILIGGSAAFLVVQDELKARHLLSLDKELVFHENAYRDGGEKALLDSLKSHMEATLDHATVFHVVGPSGKVILSNIRPSDGLPERGAVSSEALGLDEDFSFFVRSVMLGDLNVTVGISGEDISEIQEIFLQAGILAFVLLAASTLLGAFAFASISNRRIAELAAALDAVNAGRLDTRLPISRRNDDIDQIVGLVNQSIESLKAVLETNRQISSDIAHELKSPLNRLRIDVERAIGLQEGGQSATAELEGIEAETNRILATFDALLRISQIEAGARKERFAETDLAEVVALVADFYETYAEERGADLQVEIASSIPAIHGDRELLSQLLSNLIENAFRHAGKAPSIRCSLTAEDGHARLEISDNGLGIPASERDKVLQRLYRLEKSRSSPGSGLGLAMVNAIAVLHGAAIELSDNDPGLVVSISFPVGRP